MLSRVGSGLGRGTRRKPSLSVGAPLRISDVGGKAEDRGRGPEPGHVSLLVAEKPVRHGTWPAQQSGSGVSAWECPEVPVRTQAPGPVLDLLNPITRGRVQSPAATSTSWMWPAE